MPFFKLKTAKFYIVSEQKELSFPFEFIEVFTLLCHLHVPPCFGVGWGHVRSDGKLRMLFLEGAGMRCACSSVYRKDSTLLINNRLSLQPSWHSTGSVCECQSVVWFAMTERNPTNSCWNCPAVRCYRMLFTSVSWWWTSEELWDVFIEVGSCMQGEALRRSVAGIDGLSALSPVQLFCLRVEKSGLALWRRGRPVSRHTQCHRDVCQCALFLFTLKENILYKK